MLAVSSKGPHMPFNNCGGGRGQGLDCCAQVPMKVSCG